MTITFFPSTVLSSISTRIHWKKKHFLLLIFHVFLCVTLWLGIPFCDVQIKGGKLNETHFIANIFSLLFSFSVSKSIFIAWVEALDLHQDDFQWKLRFRVNEYFLFNFNETDYHSPHSFSDWERDKDEYESSAPTNWKIMTFQFLLLILHFSISIV